MPINPVDLIAGIILLIGSISTIFGYFNLASVLITVGVLIEAIKILLRSGLK